MMKIIINKHSQCTMSLSDEELGTMRYHLHHAAQEQGSKVRYMKRVPKDHTYWNAEALKTEEAQLVKVEALVEDLEAAVKAME